MGCKDYCTSHGGFDNLPANLFLVRIDCWGNVTGLQSAPIHPSTFVERVCTFPGIFELSFHFPIFSLQHCSQPMSSAPKGTKALLMRSELES
jgi:hypothetical protein